MLHVKNICSKISSLMWRANYKEVTEVAQGWCESDHLHFLGITEDLLETMDDLLTIMGDNGRFTRAN